MLKSGRKTRLQISLVQKERNRKRKETLDKKKRKVAAPGDQPKKKAESSNRSKNLSASKTPKHIIPGARRSTRAYRAYRSNSQNDTIIASHDNHNEITEQSTKIGKEEKESDATSSNSNNNDGLQRSDLIKTVVSEMLSKVERAAKVLDKARELRLSVEEENKGQRMSSISTPRSKSRRSSLESSSNDSFRKKKLKLGSIDRSMKSSIDSVKVAAVTESDVCEYIEDHIRLKQYHPTGVVRTNEDVLDSTITNEVIEGKEMEKGRRVLERAVKRGHTLVSDRVTQRHLGHEKDEEHEKVYSLKEGHERQSLAQLKSTTKPIMSRSDNDIEVKSEVEKPQLDITRTNALLPVTPEHAPVSGNIDVKESNSLNGVNCTLSLEPSVEISNKKSCRKCRQKVCRRMQACIEAVETSFDCPSNLPAAEKQGAKSISNAMEKLEKKKNEKRHRGLNGNVEQETNTSISRKTSLVEVDNEDQPIISFKRKESRITKSASTKTQALEHEDKNKYDLEKISKTAMTESGLNNWSKQKGILPSKLKNIASKIRLKPLQLVHSIEKQNLSCHDAQNLNGNLCSGISELSKNEAEDLDAHHISGKLQSVTAFSKGEKSQNNIMQENIHLNNKEPSKYHPKEKEKVNKRTPSSLKNNNDLKLNSDLNSADDEFIQKSLGVVDCPPRKRGRKPSFFYSEDDVVEITNVGGDDGLLFLSLEESPISNVKVKVAENTGKLPTSVAMHYKERKNELTYNNKITKGRRRIIMEAKNNISNDISNEEPTKDRQTKSTSEKRKRGRPRKVQRSTNLASKKSNLLNAQKCLEAEYEKPMSLAMKSDDSVPSTIGMGPVNTIVSCKSHNNLYLKEIWKSNRTAGVKSTAASNGIEESDGGSLPFNGFESSVESKSTCVETTEDEEPVKRDYVLVSSTVKDDEYTFGSEKGLKHSSKKTRKDSNDHPALKLKLVIKDKYDHRINSAPIEKTFGSIEAHENTLAGAIELKKRLLKQRRKAKRDRKRAKASVLSLSQAEKQTVSTSANKIGSKRRSSFADSFYSNAGSDGMRRNAAKMCLEKMVATQQALSDNVDDGVNNILKTQNEDPNKATKREGKSEFERLPIDNSLTVPLNVSTLTGTHSSKVLPIDDSLTVNKDFDSTDEDVLSRRYSKPRIKSKLLDLHNSTTNYCDSSAEDSTDSDRRRVSKRNAALNASVMITLANTRYEGKTNIPRDSCSDSGNCSPIHHRKISSSSASSETSTSKIKKPSISSRQPAVSKRINIFETDDVDEDSNECIDQHPDVSLVHTNSPEISNAQNESLSPKSNKKWRQSTNKTVCENYKHGEYNYSKPEDKSQVTNPFVESRECSLERSISVSPDNKLSSTENFKFCAGKTSEFDKAKRSIFNEEEKKEKPLPMLSNKTETENIGRNKKQRGMPDVDYNSGSERARIFFPREVKLDAIKLMEAGKSQAEVANDLNCSLSTVTSWWHRRHTTKKYYKSKKSSYKSKSNSQSSSGISLSPSSYDSSERDGEPPETPPDHMVSPMIENASSLNKMVSLLCFAFAIYSYKIIFVIFYVLILFPVSISVSSLFLLQRRNKTQRQEK